MNLHGRRKIITEFKQGDMLNAEKMVKCLNTSFEIHAMNKEEIDYLIDYKNGDQTILDKIKTVRPEINHKLVINHAEMISRMVTGYFLGNPIQYIQNGYSDKKDAIDQLNRVVQYEDKASVDEEVAEFASITGVGYRIIYRDGLFGDEVPFEDKALNPATTFVVYENTVAERPVMGVTYHNIYSDDLILEGARIYVYTAFGVYTIEFRGRTVVPSGLAIKSEDILGFTSYNVGGVPIIEYPNNIWRLGDWELSISLMDAINAMHSGRLDDVDQAVQSLLVFLNAEIDEERYKEMREAGVVTIKNTTNNQTKVDVINNSLDQSGMNMFAKELEELLYAIIGIPNRNNRAGGGGDTGQAVELRDGWADLEIVARKKELMFKKSEKMALKIYLSMFNSKYNENLSLLDIDVKFTRNKNNNMLVKTQSYETLLRTKTLSPEDCLTIVDLVSDVNEYISRGKTFWGDEFAGKMVDNGFNQGQVVLPKAELDE